MQNTLNIQQPVHALTQSPPMLSGALPFFGHALAFQRDRLAVFQRGYAEHGAIFGIKLVQQPVAVLIGPEFSQIFYTETDKSLNISKPYRFLKAMFGDSLFLGPHEEYLKQRQVVQEMFRRQKMAQYLQVTQEEVQAELDNWGESGEIELTSVTNRLVKRVAGNSFLGRAVNKQIGVEFWALYEDINGGIDVLIPPHWPLPKFRRRDRAKARMLAILQPIIQERKQHADRYDDIFQDIINKALEIYADFDDEMIMNLLIALMWAGHETTTGQGAWSVIHLLQNPEYLELVRAEIDAQLTPGQLFDHRAFAKLEHIQWLTKEIERMRPSADTAMRVVDEPLEVGDYTIPAGWMVQVATEVSHKLPELWRDPERFDPLRFSPERAEDKQHRFSMIGFGGGMHKCTGMNFANMEISVIVALLFQQFDVELITPNPQIERGLGANKPTETWLKYRRR